MPCLLTKDNLRLINIVILSPTIIGLELKLVSLIYIYASFRYLSNLGNLYPLSLVYGFMFFTLLTHYGSFQVSSFNQYHFLFCEKRIVLILVRDNAGSKVTQVSLRFLFMSIPANYKTCHNIVHLLFQEGFTKLDS